MDAFQRIIGRLHRVFNKDPQKVAVATIIANGTGTVEVNGTTLAIKCNYGNATFQLTGTLTALAAAIAATYGSNVVLSVTSGMGTLLSRGLLEEGITPLSSDPKLYYPQSLLYHELKAYAGILEEQSERIRAAEKELYAHTADGTWLETWLNAYFGIMRLEGEADEQYFKRAKYEILAIKVNNKALMKLIADAAGLYVEVKDLNAYYFTTNRTGSLTNKDDDVLFSVNVPYKRNAFGVYIYNGNINNLTANQKATIIKTCDRYRAAGTTALYFAPQEYVETWSAANNTQSVTNNRAYVDGPKPSGWQQVSV